MELNGIPKIIKGFFVSRSLGIAALEIRTEGKITIFIFLDNGAHPENIHLFTSYLVKLYQ